MRTESGAPGVYRREALERSRASGLFMCCHGGCPLFLDTGHVCLLWGVGRCWHHVHTFAGGVIQKQRGETALILVGETRNPWQRNATSCLQGPANTYSSTASASFRFNTRVSLGVFFPRWEFSSYRTPVGAALCERCQALTPFPEDFTPN